MTTTVVMLTNMHKEILSGLILTFATILITWSIPDDSGIGGGLIMMWTMFVVSSLGLFIGIITVVHTYMRRKVVSKTLFFFTIVLTVVPFVFGTFLAITIDLLLTQLYTSSSYRDRELERLGVFVSST